MKTTVSIAMLVASLFCLIACGDDDDSGSNNSAGSSGTGGSAGSSGASGSGTGGSGTSGGSSGAGGSGATGGSGGTADTVSQYDCETIIPLAEAAACPNDSALMDQCNSINSDLQGLTKCIAENNALVDCANTATSWSCDDKGESRVDGCTEFEDALTACLN